MSTENLKDQPLDGGQEKNTSTEEELAQLEQEVKKQEKTADNSEDFVAKKKAELEQRRQEVIDRKKKARQEAKEVKKELKSLDTDDSTDEEEPETEEKAPIEEVNSEDERYERFKKRMQEEQAQADLQQRVDDLVQVYPEASVDSLKRIEDLVPELKRHYPQLSTEELVSKAVYLELGQQVTEDTGRQQAVDASGSAPTGGAQKSNSTSYQFEILPSHKKALQKQGISEEDYLKTLERRYKAGDDISKYGGRKIR